MTTKLFFYNPVVTAIFIRILKLRIWWKVELLPIGEDISTAVMPGLYLWQFGTLKYYVVHIMYPPPFL